MKILSIPTNFKKLYKRWKLADKAHKQLVKSNWLECIHLCNQLIESAEDDLFGYYYRGQCKAKLKLFKEAISDFETSLLNLKKNRYQSLMRKYDIEVDLRIANVYRLDRNYELALIKLEELLDKHPEYSGGYKEKSGILSDMGDFASALDSANIGLKNIIQKIRCFKISGAILFMKLR